MKDHAFDVEQRLKKVCMAYNTSVNSLTGYTPFYLMFGREARLPLDLMHGTKNPQATPAPEYAPHMKQSMADTYDAVRSQHLLHLHQKDFYDKRVHGEPYKEGDLVWLHNPVVPPAGSAKLHHYWTGTYRILERMSEADYRIKEVCGKKASSWCISKKGHSETRFTQPIPSQEVDEEASPEQEHSLPLYS